MNCNQAKRHWAERHTAKKDVETAMEEAQAARDEAAESQASSEVLVQTLTAEKTTLTKNRSILLTILRGEVRFISNQGTVLDDLNTQIGKVSDLVKTAQQNSQHLVGINGEKQGQHMSDLVKAVSDLSKELHSKSLDNKYGEPMGLEPFAKLANARLRDGTQGREKALKALPQPNLGLFMNGTADLKQRHFSFEDLSNVSDLDASMIVKLEAPPPPKRTDVEESDTSSSGSSSSESIESSSEDEEDADGQGQKEEDDNTEDPSLDAATTALLQHASDEDST